MLRKVIFWTHLVAGLAAGAIIGIMCFTGTALAFEKEIVAWMERDALRVTPPADGSAPLALDEIVRRVRAAHPGLALTTAVVRNDPGSAVTLTATGAAGTTTLHVNPYTAEAKPASATKTRAFMASMVLWHRYVAMSGEQRALGKGIAGWSNVVFCALAFTGIYIWWPRKWNWRALRPSVWFVGARGKARDWNWHNTIGFWSSPILVVLTLTAMPISFVAVSNWVNSFNGPGVPAASPALTVQPPPPGTARASFESILATTRQEVPAWKQVTLRLDGGAAGRGGAAAGRGGAAAAPAGRGNTTAAAANAPAAPAARGGAANPAPTQPAGVAAVTATVREFGTWPRTATTTVALDPFTGAVLRNEGYDDLAAGRQIRAWTRFLHTGEALGPIGQFVAGLACLGGCFLVYTGFALSFRRFFGGRKRPPVATAAKAEKQAEVAVTTR